MEVRFVAEFEDAAFLVSAVCLAFLVRVLASGLDGLVASVVFAFLVFAVGCFLALVVLGFGVVCGVVEVDDGVATGNLVGEIVGGG